MQDQSETTNPGASRLRYWLRFGGNTIPLGLGSFTLGRHVSCALTFEDALVSRRHAELRIEEASATITDLGSANGVYVNGTRIAAPTRVDNGDRILLGSQELVIVRMTESGRPRAELQTRADRRLPPLPPAPMLMSEDEEDEEELPMSSGARTARADALDVLGGVAQKLLVKGQALEAERVLAGHLANVLQQARAAGVLYNKPEVIAKAAARALTLATGTKKSDWVTYLFELYTHTQRAMPTEIVDGMYALAHGVPLDLAALRGYLEVLRARSAELAPNERFLIRRLEGLEQLVLAK